MAWHDYLAAISPATLLGKGITGGYAKPILGTAGSIAGGMVAGPAGAGVGGTAGTALGSAADNYFSPQQASGQMRSQNGVPGSPEGNALTGYSGYNTQLSQYAPNQQATQDWLLQQGQQNANFQGIEDRARKNFQTNTIPGIAERFAQFGGSGTRTSSGFQNSLGQAGAELESQLGAMRGQFGMSQLQQGLAPRYENIYTKPQEGMAQSAAPYAAEFLAKLPELYQVYQDYQKNQLGGNA